MHQKSVAIDMYNTSNKTHSKHFQMTLTEFNDAIAVLSENPTDLLAISIPGPKTSMAEAASTAFTPHPFIISFSFEDADSDVEVSEVSSISSP